MTVSVEENYRKLVGFDVVHHNEVQKLKYDLEDCELMYESITSEGARDLSVQEQRFIDDYPEAYKKLKAQHDFMATSEALECRWATYWNSVQNKIPEEQLSQYIELLEIQSKIFDALDQQPWVETNELYVKDWQAFLNYKITGELDA